MDIRPFALLVFVGVLGSFAEARAGFFGFPFENGGASAIGFAASPRLTKRAVDSNGETTTEPTTTSQATTTTPKSTDPTTTPPSTTTPPTSPTTTPTTTEPTTTAPTTTTEATSPTTTPTTTSATTPTTPVTTTPAPSTTPESTKPTSKPKKPVDVLSRSNIDDEPEESTKKPGPSLKNDKAPMPGPYFGPGGPGTFGPGFNPYYGYPGFNSIPGSGPNYAWTGTNNGQGYASAGASAGSFAGGYPGYSTGGFPGPESPSIGSRGGFQDSSPSQNGYGYGGIDPLYNAGPGFFYPGQFPTYPDPYEMFKQIQAQIEAQHQAAANSVPLNRGGLFASNIPNYPYTYASANMNNMGLPSRFGGSFNSGVGNSNMELQNRLANEAASYGGGGYGGGTPQVASASIGLGPGGGFQMGQISPAAPGIQSRFSEDLPAPSGNSYGVFASSSSSSMTGPDGKQVNRKSSVTGVNDNGKVSFREVHD